MTALSKTWSNNQTWNLRRFFKDSKTQDSRKDIVSLEYPFSGNEAANMIPNNDTDLQNANNIL